METNFPEGFQEQFFRVSSSNVPETLRRVSNNQVYVPCGMKHTVVQVPDNEHDPDSPMHDEDRYAWIGVRLPYRGEDLSDLEAFYVARYSDLRHFFYGSAFDQLEMKKDSLLGFHQLAVQSMFKKADGLEPDGLVKFIAYRKQFWQLIASVLAQYGNGKTIADLPEFFNAGDLLEMAKELGIDDAMVLNLTLQIQTLTLNLIAQQMEYMNLFPFKEEYLEA